SLPRRARTPSRVPGSCAEPAEALAAFRGDAHRARAPHAQDPAPREVHLEEGRAERAADVWAPLRQVHARVRERAPRVACRLDVDAESGEPLPAERRHAEVASLGGEPARI